MRNKKTNFQLHTLIWRFVLYLLSTYGLSPLAEILDTSYKIVVEISDCLEIRRSRYSGFISRLTGGCKKNFMLNTTVHEISTAHKN